MKKIIIAIACIGLLASCKNQNRDSIVKIDANPKEVFMSKLRAGDTVLIQYGSSIESVKIDCIYRNERKVLYTFIRLPSLSDISDFNSYVFENVHLINTPCNPIQ